MIIVTAVRFKLTPKSSLITLAINGVATQFGGGGHAQASGAKIDTLDQLPEFIAALDALF